MRNKEGRDIRSDAKEEILAMEAGRKLDELVEQSIFGLVRGYRHDGSRCWKDERGIPVQSEAKPYSTDISAAWQVVEKMKEEGHLLLLELLGSVSGDWHAEFGKGYFPYVLDGQTKAKSAPEAICKAALLAKVKQLGECFWKKYF